MHQYVPLLCVTIVSAEIVTLSLDTGQSYFVQTFCQMLSAKGK